MLSDQYHFSPANCIQRLRHCDSSKLLLSNCFHKRISQHFRHFLSLSGRQNGGVRQHRLLYRYIILSRFILHTELHRSDSVSHSSLSSPPFNCFQLWFSQQMLRLLISHLWF
uniref:Ovule protein n=1 Tax=Heterorhabditis bacteriophora TaxID=37862 RepID=A0A1I7WLY8_HETBA